MVSLALTWTHPDSIYLNRSQLISFRLIWAHLISLGLPCLTWSLLDSLCLTGTPSLLLDLTWPCLVSLALTGSHLVPFRLAWSDLVSLGLAWSHPVSISLVSLCLNWSHSDPTIPQETKGKPPGATRERGKPRNTELTLDLARQQNCRRTHARHERISQLRGNTQLTPAHLRYQLHGVYTVLQKCMCVQACVFVQMWICDGSRRAWHVAEPLTGQNSGQKAIRNYP